MPKKLLNYYRRLIPWLNQIPDTIYFQLDTSEFYLPNEEINQVRIKLEKQLDNFVMTYDRRIFNTDIPLAAHLCANLKGAKLNHDQLKLLLITESRLKNQNISFVVYKRPLTFINPTSSWLYQLKNRPPR